MIPARVTNPASSFERFTVSYRTLANVVYGHDMATYRGIMEEYRARATEDTEATDHAEA